MSNCHTPQEIRIQYDGSIALVGHPNVGKSVIFQLLTGQHATISNYPGTTVEVIRGASRDLEGVYVVDTPGVVTFPARSEDERVAARVLLAEPLRAIIQVGDAKNLRRTLLLTVQLAEMSLPFVLALNMMDEAVQRGVQVNHYRLAEHLGAPVVPTTAVRGEGIPDLTNSLRSANPPNFRLHYPDAIEAAVAKIANLLSSNGIASPRVSLRSLALSWLAGDGIVEQWLRDQLQDHTFSDLVSLRETLQISFHEPVPDVIHDVRLAFVERVAAAVSTQDGASNRSREFLARLTTHSVWGLMILGVVLYALYWFVGIFGAGTLVDLLETNLFGEIINPRVTVLVERFIPIPFLQDLLIGEYGLWTIGMTYAFALILPIVTTFFIAFGILEDSGYLPRLAALTNRMFQALGLNGKAVLPMVLGLGCVTMATMTTRVMESRRERLLVTLLLALAVPCSAQLGVVMGMLAGISLGATMIWSVVVLLVLFLVGWLASLLTPGERTPLLVELPPLRLPLFSNVLLKTIVRLEWYLKEVVPLFLAGAFILFILDRTGWLAWFIRLLEPVVAGWLGLPAEASAAFLMGFLRRDFGATGLFLMTSQGLMTHVQVVVAMVTITLFIPCIASVMMISRERGWKTAAGMVVIIIPLAFFVGGILNRVLLFVGWS